MTTYNEHFVGRLDETDRRTCLGLETLNLITIEQAECSIKTAPLVLANILAPILLMLFDVGMADLVEPGGILCLSGILEDQEEKVRKMAESKGLTFIKRMQVKDWVAMSFRK